MEATPRRVLVVLNRPVSTRALAQAVRRRAARDDCHFTLLVPAVAHGLHRVVDPEDACCEEAERAIRGLLPALEQAAGSRVAARIGSHEMLAAIEDAVNDAGYDEVMFASGPNRIERLLRVDLPRKVAALGVEVRAAA
jgi:hypothetical protein